MATKIRVYAVQAEGAPADQAVTTQIEITCEACGPQPLRYVVPGHHLRMLRDILIELVDQFPTQAGKEAGPKQKTESFTVPVPPGARPTRPEDN